MIPLHDAREAGHSGRKPAHRMMSRTGLAGAQVAAEEVEEQRRAHDPKRGDPGPVRGVGAG
jgi:hypothetical protein